MVETRKLQRNSLYSPAFSFPKSGAPPKNMWTGISKEMYKKLDEIRKRRFIEGFMSQDFAGGYQEMKSCIQRLEDGHRPSDECIKDIINRQLATVRNAKYLLEAWGFWDSSYRYMVETHEESIEDFKRIFG